MMPSPDIPWLRRLGPERDRPPTARLLCFAHAGAGVSSFNLWPGLVPSWLDVVCVQLPGREDRSAHPSATRVRHVVSGALREVEALGGLPIAFYGHCLGSLLAFELCREIRRRRGRLPIWLFVSGRRPPHAGTGRVLHDLSEERLLDELRAMGASSPTLEHPRWRRYYIDALRSDLEITDRYVFDPETPLPLPITVFVGRDDPRREEQGWSFHSAEGCDTLVLDGGHFFSRSGLEAMTGIIAGRIRDIVGDPPDPVGVAGLDERAVDLACGVTPPASRGLAWDRGR